MRYKALPSTFRALRHRNFRLFFFGQMVSLIGTWMRTIAQQWLVYRLTGFATMLGTVNLMGILPLLPLSLWGGLLADRFPLVPSAAEIVQPMWLNPPVVRLVLGS